jgi:hypothetical protein
VFRCSFNANEGELERMGREWDRTSDLRGRERSGRYFDSEKSLWQKGRNNGRSSMLYFDDMEPLSNHDPIHKLLGKARAVEPRPNFTQNVLRAIRQTPQTVSLWERVSAWLGGFGMPRVALAGAMAAVAVGLIVMAMQKPEPQTSVVAEKKPTAAPSSVAPPALHEVSAAMILAATAPLPEAKEPELVDPMGVLLVEQDTSALTNSDLALLAY